MKNTLNILLLAICFLFCGFYTAYANESSGCEGYKGKLLNRCHIVIHPEREHPRGVGADILIHETDLADFVAEYKYDGKNEEHSIFGIVKTKKSLVEYSKDAWSYVKGLFDRG